MRKTVTRVCFGLLMFTFSVAVALGQTYTQESSGGVTYTMETNTSSTCPVGAPSGPFETITAYTYYDFVYAGVALGGSSTYIVSPGGAYCPPNGINGPNPAVLTGTGYTGDFYSCADNSGCSVSVVSSVPGILYPKFEIASIIYDTPGNHSNNGFTATLTDGTTTTTGSNFGSSITDTFSVTGGFLGSGDTLSWSAGVAITDGSSTAVTDTIAQATGVLNASNTSGLNAVNHQQDLFIIWLNPAVSFTQTGTDSANYSLGTQYQTTGDPSPGTPEMQDHVEVYAQAMMANSSGVTTVPVETLQPQVVDGQTLPGLANICAKPTYYPSSCTLANQCGCVPSDFTTVLAQDPLLNYTSTESPLGANTSSSTLCTNPAATASCRYVPIMTINDGTTQVVELLQGPDDVGGNNPVNTFAQTDTTQTNQTLSQSISYSVGYSWDVKWMFAGSGLDFKSQPQFTWGNTESAGEINMSAHQMSVSLSSSTVGCSEYIPIFEDTVYHTFVFQGQVGDTSCP
jgi:hypothetical protein